MLFRSPKQDATIPSVADRASKVAVAYATEDSTVGDVNKSIQDERNGVATNLAEAVAVAAPTVKSDADAGMYQSIQSELNQMNFYFSAFQKILASMNNSKDKDSACVKLSDIKQCE